MSKQKRPAWAIRVIVSAGEVIKVTSSGEMRFGPPVVRWICKPARMKASSRRR